MVTCREGVQPRYNRPDNCSFVAYEGSTFAHNFDIPFRLTSKPVSIINILDRDYFCIYNVFHSIASATWSLVESIWGRAR